MNYEFQIYGCKNGSEIDILNKRFHTQNIKENPELNKENLDYLTLWQRKVEIEQPGRREYKALGILITYKRKLPIKMKKWATACYDLCCDLFGKDNILSCVYIDSPETPGCLAFVFPMVGRELKGEYWLDEKGQLRNDIERSLRKRLEHDIGNFPDEEAEQARQKLLEEAKTYPRLNRMIIEQTDNEDDNFWLKEQQEELIYDTLTKEMSIQTDLPYAQLKEIVDKAVNYFTQGVEKRTFKDAILGQITSREFLIRVDRYLDSTYHNLSNNDKSYIKEKILSAVFGYYVLDQLIEDDEISDIKIIDWDKIRVKMRGKRYTSNLTFQNRADLDRFMDGVAMRNNLDFSLRPQSIFFDIDTSPLFRLRFDVTAPLVNSGNKYYLHIRKTPKTKRSLDALVNEAHMMPMQVAKFLKEEVSKNSILIVGKGSAGKTTILNQLLEWIPYDKAGAVIQESDELFSDNHPEIEFQNIVYAEQSITGQEIGLKELTRAALVSDQDVIVIGEVKGGEALYAINAAMTGYIFICTVHADSSQSGIDKMADYITYESSYDKETATYMLKAIKNIVFMKDFKVEEISQVVGWDEEKKRLKYEMIYARNPKEYLERKEKGLVQ